MNDETHALPGRIGRYVVLAELGSGGGGTVYSAFDERLDRRIAIKVVTERATDDVVLREAQALAKLSHPNVAQVYEVGEDRGRLFLAMEHIKGLDLRRWVARERPSIAAIVECHRQAGAGLAAAHAAGLVHRDVKPDNLVRGVDGRVRVVDFGVAGEAHIRASARDAEAPHRRGELTLSDPAGTPAYMAPEQLSGGDIDARSDQFGLCVALFEALVGVRPFVGDDPSTLLAAIARGESAMQPSPRIPGALRRTIARGLAAEPASRWPDMTSLVEALAPARSQWRTIAFVGAATTLAAGAFAASLRAPTTESPCSGGEAALTGVLDEARIASVGDAIAGTKSPIAADVAGRVRAQLTERRTVWLDTHLAVCEATAVRHEQSPEVLDSKMTCLHRARASIDGVMKALAEPDAALVVEAIGAVERAPRSEACSELASHGTLLATPPAEHAERVEQAFSEIAALQLRADAGDADAATQIIAWVERAEGFDYDPLVATALYARGTQVGKALSTKQSAQDIARAHQLAVGSGDDELAMRTASYLGSVVGAELGRLEEGLAWAEIAEAWWRRGDRDLAAHVRLAVNRIKTASAQGKLEEATRLGATALDELTRSGETGGLIEAALRQGLTANAVRRDALPEAFEHASRMLVCFEATYGDAHPMVAEGLASLASVLLRIDRLEDAEAAARRAYTILVDVYGPNDLRLYRAMSPLGEIARARGYADEALDWHERSLAVLEASVEPGHARLALGLYNVANAALEAGAFDRGLQAIERAVELRERNLPAGHASIALASSLRDKLRVAARQIDPATDDPARAVETAKDPRVHER